MADDGAVTLLEPFRIAAPDADLRDLRRRLSAARWPTRETVSDWSRDCRSRCYVRSVNIGGRRTTGRRPSGASTGCLTTEPRSTDSLCTSFTCAHRSPMLFH